MIWIIFGSQICPSPKTRTSLSCARASLSRLPMMVLQAKSEGVRLSCRTVEKGQQKIRAGSVSEDLRLRFRLGWFRNVRGLRRLAAMRGERTEDVVEVR